MMVAVVGIPMWCASRMIRAHSAVEIFCGQIFSRTGSTRISADCPAHRSKTRPFHRGEYRFCIDPALSRGIGDLHRVARVEMHSRRSFADPAVDVDIGLRDKCRVQAADRADFSNIAGLCKGGFLPDYLFIVEIGSFVITGFLEKPQNPQALMQMLVTLMFWLRT